MTCRPKSSADSSRLDRVGASITRCAEGPLRRGGRRQGFLPIWVSSTYLSKCADGGQLGPRERPECRQIGDAELGLQLPLAGEAVEVRRRYRRGGGARDLDPFAQIGVGEEGVGGNHLAGGEAHDLAGEIAGRDFAHLELAGRDVERGERDGCLAAALRALEQGGEVVAGLGVEQAVLGQRAGRDEAHDVAVHDRLGAALPGLGRVFHLLADGNPETLGDQPLQVFVGAVDRHAAHGDVFAQMLAALGEHDAERFGGGDRVLEEQLVEVAHPVEQHAIGIGGLDLEELRHRRA